MSKTTTGKLPRAADRAIAQPPTGEPEVPLSERYAVAAGEYARRTSDAAMMNTRLVLAAHGGTSIPPIEEVVEAQARLADEFEACSRAWKRAWDELSALLPLIAGVAGKDGVEAVAKLSQFSPERIGRTVAIMRPFLRDKLAAVGKLLA